MKLPLRITPLLAASLLSAASSARAADKKACLEAAEKGQDLRDRGKLIEAREAFVVCSDAACPGPVPKYCAEWLSEARRRIPTIVLRVTTPEGNDVADANVLVDGAAVEGGAGGKPLELDPGSHQLEVRRAGARDHAQTLVLAQGEKDRLVVVRLEALGEPTKAAPPPPPPPEPSRAVPVASWVGWGVGAVGLLGFAGFGLKANLDYGDYESTCGDRCDASARDDVKGTMVLADTFLVVGVVAAAVGTVFYFVDRGSRESSAPSAQAGARR